MVLRSFKPRYLDRKRIALTDSRSRWLRSPSFCRFVFSQHGGSKNELSHAGLGTSTSGQPNKRKVTRTSNPGSSLRKIALEAERSREGLQRRQTFKDGSRAKQTRTEKDVTAYCAAEAYRMQDVLQRLQDDGLSIDPCKTALYPQVVHFQMPVAGYQGARLSDRSSGQTLGDVFVFPSGTIVAWDVDKGSITSLIDRVLLPAATNAHAERMETEDLDYFEDTNSEKSALIGDTIRIGTKAPLDLTLAGQSSADAAAASNDQSQASMAKEQVPSTPEQLQALDGQDLQTHQTNLALTKIAFSSGLARSTKLAVLEALLDRYFESTSSVPSLLSAGVRLPARYRNRAFILRKTGELLSVRAQLNLTELTDKVPDLFWDARHELGLDGLFDQVGRVLDVGWRMRVLNERVDYAADIAEVLRGSASERHGFFLENLIIVLISVEVGFEGWKIWKEQFAAHEADDTDALLRRCLKLLLKEAEG